MEIFDISKKGSARRVYAFEEIMGMTGLGDVTYNPRRNFLGAISLSGKIAYHLFKIDINPSKVDNAAVQLCRKTKWSPEYTNSEDNFISGFDFDPNGEKMATITQYGECLISDVHTDDCNFYLSLEMSNAEDCFGRCRWNTCIEEPFLFVKYDRGLLNILDAVKETLTLKNSVPIQDSVSMHAYCIDVCPTQGNLIASCGDDRCVGIYDRRESKLEKGFALHSKPVVCVRWNPTGDTLVSASLDKKIKLIDFKTGKVLHTEVTKNSNRFA